MIISDATKKDILDLCQYITETEEDDYNEQLLENDIDSPAINNHIYTIAQKVLDAFASAAK